MADAPEVAPTPEVVAPVVEEPKVEDDKKSKVKPMSPTRQLSGQVDNLLSQIKKEEDAKPAEDKPAEEPAPAKEENKEPPVAAPETPVQEPELDEPAAEPVELPPREQYILANLPEVTTIGHVGEEKDKIIKVKVGVKELPPDFEFADKATELQFMQDIAAQELTARDLEKQYTQQVQQQAYEKAMTDQAIDVAKEIGQLQAAGLLDKFQYNENDPKFNDDPAVKEANAIYKVFEDTNNKYIREGRSYRITYTDAADKYLAAKARQEAQEPKKPVVETPPNKEREEVAAKVSAPSGAKPGNPVKGAWPGMDSQDIIRMVNRGQI